MSCGSCGSSHEEEEKKCYKCSQCGTTSAEVKECCGAPMVACGSDDKCDC